MLSQHSPSLLTPLCLSVTFCDAGLIQSDFCKRISFQRRSELGLAAQPVHEKTVTQEGPAEFRAVTNSRDVERKPSG